jgi:hypothetical protein
MHSFKAYGLFIYEAGLALGMSLVCVYWRVYMRKFHPAGRDILLFWHCFDSCYKIAPRGIFELSSQQTGQPGQWVSMEKFLSRDLAFFEKRIFAIEITTRRGEISPDLANRATRASMASLLSPSAQTSRWCLGRTFHVQNSMQTFSPVKLRGALTFLESSKTSTRVLRL